MFYNSNAVPSNVHLQFRPASLLTSKKDLQGKTLGNGNKPNSEANNRSCFPLRSREILRECKFGDHIFPTHPSKCTEAYKEPNPLFTRKRPGRELRLLHLKQHSLTWQNIWLTPFIASQIIFLLFSFFAHVYTKQLSLLFIPVMNF